MLTFTALARQERVTTVGYHRVELCFFPKNSIERYDFMLASVLGYSKSRKIPPGGSSYMEMLRSSSAL